MISGTQLVITRRGIYAARRTLETIGVNPGTLVHILPMRTFEYRPKESGRFFPRDLLLTPIVPSLWPFVMRFSLRLRNRPNVLRQALDFFRQQGLNILFGEATRSGHHHSNLSILAEVRPLEAATLDEILRIIRSWAAQRAKLYRTIYLHLYPQDLLKYFFDGDPLSEVHPFGSPQWFQSFTHSYRMDPPRREFWKGRAWTRETIRQTLEVHPHFGQKDRMDILFELAGEYLMSKYGAPPQIGETPRGDDLKVTIREALEKEVRAARPRIEEIEEELGQGDLQENEAYNAVEDLVLPLRMMLLSIVTCKRVLCEKYKILLLHHALKEGRKRTAGGLIQPRNVYLYNVQYYRSVLKYPYFAERAILHSTAGNENGPWCRIRDEVLEGLKQLDTDRRRQWEIETRADLDPIVIGSVESLCHAYYHRAYERDLKTAAGDGVIRFPEAPGLALDFLHELLPEEDSATIAVASRSTDDLTLRVCLLPINALKRFVSIRLPRYQRTCRETCQVRGTHHMRTKLWRLVMEAETPEKEDAGSACAGAAARSRSGDPSPSEKTSGQEAGPVAGTEAMEPGIGSPCYGTSAGLMGIMTQALRDVGRNMTPEGDEDLNIWHINNDTYQMEEDSEQGSFSMLAQSTDQGFQAFPTDFAVRLNESFQGGLRREFRHIAAEKVQVSQLSGGRVFVSLPFDHCMSNTWLASITRIGKQMGFTEVRTVKEFTGPVTSKVAECIRESHAMVQILAIPQPDAGETRRLDPQTSPLIWLDAEYLTAVNCGLHIVRLVDRTSIEFARLLIGRDHPALLFSSSCPLSAFEKTVRQAFFVLRQALGNRLGLA